MEPVRVDDKRPSHKSVWVGTVPLFLYMICFLLLAYAFTLPADNLPGDHVAREQASFIMYATKTIIDFAWIVLLLVAFGCFKLITKIGYPPKFVSVLALLFGFICSILILSNTDAVLIQWGNLYFLLALMAPLALLMDHGFNRLDKSLTIIVEDVLKWATLFPVLFFVMFMYVDESFLVNHGGFLLFVIIASVYVGIYTQYWDAINSGNGWFFLAVFGVIRCSVIIFLASMAFSGIAASVGNAEIEKMNFECLQNQIEALEQDRERPRCGYLNK